MAAIKVVSIWNPKGGQGKSTLAINLAAAAVEMGIKPLVICQDPQGTAVNYFNEGNLSFEVITAIPEKKPDADIVFIDHQASDWQVPEGNIVVMPLKPARDQYATYIDAYKRAKNAGKEIITVVTDSQQHRESERKTTEFLTNEGAYLIPASGVFSRAAEEYRSIFDDALTKAYKVKLRRSEITKILGAILLKENED